MTNLLSVFRNKSRWTFHRINSSADCLYLGRSYDSEQTQCTTRTHTHKLANIVFPVVIRETMLLLQDGLHLDLLYCMDRPSSNQSEASIDFSNSSPFPIQSEDAGEQAAWGALFYFNLLSSFFHSFRTLRGCVLPPKKNVLIDFLLSELGIWLLRFVYKQDRNLLIMNALAFHQSSIHPPTFACDDNSKTPYMQLIWTM